jgi:hypothetical protein
LKNSSDKAGILTQRLLGSFDKRKAQGFVIIENSKNNKLAKTAGKKKAVQKGCWTANQAHLPGDHRWATDKREAWLFTKSHQ